MATTIVRVNEQQILFHSIVELKDDDEG